MNFFKNIVFLSKLITMNISELFKSREKVNNEPLNTDSIKWYGHATTIMNLSGVTVITDPVFTNHLGFLFKRVIDRPVNLKGKKFDYILLSHGHSDHLDFGSLMKLDKSTTVIAPKGYGKILRMLGFKNTVVLRHGEVYEDDKIKITSYKAEHDGRRFYMGIDNESHSFLIERNDKKVFFAGDTAYTESFEGIDCDVALMPVGCYKPERFSYMHCSPVESYKMFKMMNASIMIPIHYKTFKLSLENFDETYDTLINLKDEKLKILNVGETFNLKEIAVK